MQLIAYGIAVLIIAAINWFVVINFLKYRFKGDKVPVILTVFGIFFAINIIFTLSLLYPTASQGPSNVPAPQFR